MGNSPSRSELHGDHMSSIVNNSGQETFQSHSYPAKFSAVPGIHNEQFNGTVVSSASSSAASSRQSSSNSSQRGGPSPEFNGGGGSGRSSGGGGVCPTNRNGNHQNSSNSGGPNTPDLLYSMDSLNVCGNNSSSITSAELPPSSISPANCRDPWSPSSFSDESIRNLSRLHKDHHHHQHKRHSDDEGLSSSSTYESDSLNPDATLSGMSPQKQLTYRPYHDNHQSNQGTLQRRETSPGGGGKPEVAQEATELTLLPLLKSSSGPITDPSNIIDHSITINGRKVSGCEETPLPIIVGLPSDSDLPNGRLSVSSKIGITSSDLPKVSPPLSSVSSSCSSINNNGGMGTIKRGSRMKSPPPPPPPCRAPNGHPEKSHPKSCPNEKTATTTTVAASVPEISEKMSSLNSLMRRNISFNGTTSHNPDSDHLLVSGRNNEGEVNVIQTQLSSQHPEKSTTSLSTDHDEQPPGSRKLLPSEEINAEKSKCTGLQTDQSEKQAALQDFHVDPFQRDTDEMRGNEKQTIADKIDECKVNTEENKVADKMDDDDDTTDILIRPCELSKQSESRENEERPIREAARKEETVNEQNHDTTTNKTELDCKDANQDVFTNGCSGSMSRIEKAGVANTRIINEDEIKPVSCSSNDKNEDEILVDRKEEAAEEMRIKMMGNMINSKNKDERRKETSVVKKLVIDDHPENVRSIENGEIAGVEFPEMSENQLQTGFGVAENVMKNDKKMFDSSNEDGCLVEAGKGGFESKFGTEENKQEQEKRGDDRDVRENTPPSSKRPGSSSSSSPLMMAGGGGGEVGNKSSSNSSSRRGSLSSSSVDLNVVERGGMPIPIGATATQTSNGILNSCNRISLCSLPDNEVDVDSFESPSPPMLDSETIQDQPLAWKNNSPILKPDVVATVEKEREQPSRNENDNLDENFTGRKGKSGDRNTFFNHGHQRKLSMSKIELDWSRIKGDKQSVASSAPTSAGCPFDKRTVSRKASFPELYVNTANFVRPSVERKLSVGGNEKAHSNRDYSGGPGFFDSTNPFLCVGGENDGKESHHLRRNGSSQFAKNNEFLQTLGEIYACKSKLLTNSNNNLPQQQQQPIVTAAVDPVIISEAPTSAEPVADPVSSGKLKSRDASMDTVDGFESQDRSISEYNISPRSARELVTESLLNGNSICSSTVSQVSIVTINDSETGDKTNPPLPPAIDHDGQPMAFSAGIEMRNPFFCGDHAEGNNGADVVIARVVTQSNSLTSNGANSGTYRKKPSFGGKPRGSTTTERNSLPSVEIFETPLPPSKNNNKSDDNLIVASGEDDKPLFPVPPPMPPPLQFCRNNSYSSSIASSSSMGDSVQTEGSQDKNKSPCFDERPLKRIIVKTSSNNGSRISPDRTLPKLNGSSSSNASSECSLIELSLANQRSTSDAIIVELKKAQAKKLKFAEQKSSEEFSDLRNCNVDKPTAAAPAVAIVQVAESSSPANSSRPEDSHEKILGEKVIGCCGGSSIGQTISEPSHVVGDPPVKTIVNGKHTNSIIVNETPVVLVTANKKESLKRGRGVCCSTSNKSSIAQPRGNIMSPSLSGNYTEMNGIDSETMGASSIHEDEQMSSGHLKQQQKENHINELHDNVVATDEVQTNNSKLDGASFRRVLSEYEKTLSMFIQQIDQLKQRMDDAETEKQTLIKERDQALEDLRNVESAFSDVHRKYERAKALLENMKSNEDTLIRRDQEMMQRIQNRDKKIDMIKEKAQESIEKMHLDYETRIKEMEFENAKLRAQYRKMEMKLSTLENDVEQKAKENAQLSALCDELINGQVGQV